MNSTDFSTLALQPALLENLKTLGYHNMTPIQAESLPFILNGRDVIAQGKTGSGKTAAFGLGLLEKLNVKRFRVQTLVLCPTRELADQVAKEIRRLARTIHNIKVLTLCGGMPFGPQIGSLEHGAHIIVGTPGRIEEHLRKGTLTLNDLNTFILDEADRMLDMGFQQTLDNIISYMPEDHLPGKQSRQTLLFSATFPEQIQTIAKRIMHNPEMVQVESTHDTSSIQQYFYKVDNNLSRITALQLLLLHYRPDSTVVFCNTKRDTQEVADQLSEQGFSVMALHGDLEQKERDQTLVCFANKSVSILVATDVAARGLDIETMDAVFNYQIARELEVHVHRIGRTGRAGHQGLACTLYSDKEQYKFDSLQDYLKQQFDTDTLPPSNLLKQPTYKPSMATLQINGGKKQKVRAGDILGALTANKDIEGKQIGKISIFDRWAYVAVNREVAPTALNILNKGKLKGRSFQARQISHF